MHLESITIIFSTHLSTHFMPVILHNMTLEANPVERIRKEMVPNQIENILVTSNLV